ncbi:MAG: glycosyltransferase [Labilibaculum sp.]|nr:glycosyltransferase [Labilibaculum sp.]
MGYQTWKKIKSKMIQETIEISVLMCVYDEPEDWLRQSIDSVLNQSFDKFEFIIVNDNPKSALIDKILNHYKRKDNRIIILNNECNLGLTKSLNKGLKIAKGKYIARMDADDISFKNRFERQYDYMMSNPSIVACGAWAETIGLGKKINKTHLLTDSKDIHDSFVLYAPFIHPTLFIRNSTLVRNSINYDESFKRAQDYKLALDLMKVGKLGNIPHILLQYRISINQVTNIHSSDQVKSASRVRRLTIVHFLKELGVQSDVPFSINIDYINWLISIESKTMDISLRKDSVERRFNTIRMISYLSLKRYSFRSLFHFLFSFDYLKYPYNFKRFLVVLIKHVKPNQWQKYL